MRFSSSVSERCYSQVTTLTNMSAESQTVFAGQLSQRLRRYLVSVAAQEDEDAFLQYNLLRQTYGTCDFILERQAFHTWKNSKGSQILGLIGGPGSGKSIISSFLYSQAQVHAKEHSPVIWLHCNQNTRSSRLNLLRSLTWKVVEQRPDILLKKLHDQGHYIRLFHEAKTFEMLWPIFVQVVGAIRELWIIIDSIHDIKDGRSLLIENLRSLINMASLHTQIKIVLSSRHVSDLSVVTNNMIEYTAQDMQQGIATYVGHELASSKGTIVDGPSIRQLSIDRIQSLGGGLHWARAVIHLIKSTSSEDHARCLLSSIGTQESVIGHLWDQVLSTNQSQQELVQNLGEMMATHILNPLSVMRIYDMLAERKPEVVAGVGVDVVGKLVKHDFAGLLSTSDGRYGMPNEIGRLLLQEMLAKPDRQDDNAAFNTHRPAQSHTTEQTSSWWFQGSMIFLLLLLSCLSSCTRISFVTARWFTFNISGPQNTRLTITSWQVAEKKPPIFHLYLQCPLTTIPLEG